MGRVEIPPLYKQYFVDKADERRVMFEKIATLYHPQKGIYPGSFVHITPSFYIPQMTYIDSDKRISKFFNDDNVTDYIEENKRYKETSSINGVQSDYSKNLPIDKNSFDIMFSLYAGFISQSCKTYLKNEGILVCNNSHGDASLACIDQDYELIGVIKRRGSEFNISNKDLPAYFIKKDGSPIDRAKVEKRMIGENFTKKGFAYIFRYSRKER
jgi:hypothetical protein